MSLPRVVVILVTYVAIRNMEVKHAIMPVRPSYYSPLMIWQKLDNKLQVDMIVLDFDKAFYKVPHERLGYKLNICGIGHEIHN